MLKITKNNEKMVVVSPYNTAFVSGAKKLGGKWNGNGWVFDVDNEPYVKELCLKTYGEYENLAAETVTIRIELDTHTEAKIAGFVFANRRYRDSAVRLSDNVIIVEGGFPSSGGSSKYPCLNAYKGTILEVKKFPKSVYDSLENKDGITIVDTKINKDALLKEKENLIARLAEIDKLLAE